MERRFWQPDYVVCHRSAYQWQEYWGEPREMAAAWSQVYLKAAPDAQRPIHTHLAADYQLDDRIRENTPRNGASDSLDAGCKFDQLPPLPARAPAEPQQ